METTIEDEKGFWVGVPSKGAYKDYVIGGYTVYGEKGLFDRVDRGFHHPIIHIGFWVFLVLLLLV